MDETHVRDVHVDVGAGDDAVLVCTTDRALQADVTDALDEEFQVRTADSEPEAVASIDQRVTVVVVDVRDEAFTLDRLAAERRRRDWRYQIVAVVRKIPGHARRERAEAFVHAPVDADELRSTVRWAHRRSQFDRTLAAYYSLSEAYASVRTDPEPDSEAVDKLEARLATLRDELDAVAEDLDDEDAYEVALDAVRDRDA